MNLSSKRVRRALVLGVTAVTAAATIAYGATALAAAKPSSHGHGFGHHHYRGPGYPAPGGIYAPFTNCPLLNPLMQESTPGDATGCVAGDATTGSITIGNITTAVTEPVTVQFGIWDPVNASNIANGNQFTGGVLTPLNGLAGQLVGAPDLVPGGLLKALGCPSTDPIVERLCTEATKLGGRFLDVYAQAQSAGPITNFDLVTWTQPLMFQLINPLLGPNCYIGSTDEPVVVNPQLTGNISIENDPHPKKHPDTEVLKISDGTATDTTFSAPGVTGCGPGGTANVDVDTAIDTAAGLPSASGSNSLTLSGTFYLAACYAPANMANILLSAFLASVGKPAAKANESAGRPLSAAILRGHYGIK
jgi:hypothetical protein